MWLDYSLQSWNFLSWVLIFKKKIEKTLTWHLRIRSPPIVIFQSHRWWLQSQILRLCYSRLNTAFYAFLSGLGPHWCRQLKVEWLQCVNCIWKMVPKLMHLQRYVHLTGNPFKHSNWTFCWIIYMLYIKINGRLHHNYYILLVMILCHILVW